MKQRRNTLNIINFVRGVEERYERDLFGTTQKEVELVKKYGFRNTFLLQYDAMILQEYQELFLDEKDEKMELGLWIEIVQPLCEKVGIPWESKLGFRWDWHVKPGFLMAYTQEERRKLLDECMRQFLEIFGEYPRVAGSWIMDSFSMNYLREKYGMDAFCVCRDQWGTDCYTLWGGYFNQGYYPCKKNMLIPAQTKDEQIPVPVFRMLGSDPIEQYDAGCDEEYNMAKAQPVCTLEPVWPSGADPAWVDWYLQENYTAPALGFSYTQAGQENSFGWDNFGDALVMQFDKIKQLEQANRITVETLGETGRWFMGTYKDTPAAAQTFLKDWKEDGRQSVWYNSKFYRINLYCEEEKVWIRDFQRFDQNRADRYLTVPCAVDDAIYDALPYMDGYRWSGEGLRAGIYLDGVEKIVSAEEEENGLRLFLKKEDGSQAEIQVAETWIKLKNCGLSFQYLKKSAAEIYFDKRTIAYTYDSWEYRLELEKGLVHGKNILPENSEIILHIN